MSSDLAQAIKKLDQQFPWLDQRIETEIAQWGPISDRAQQLIKEAKRYVRDQRSQPERE